MYLNKELLYEFELKNNLRKTQVFIFLDKSSWPRFVENCAASFAKLNKNTALLNTYKTHGAQALGQKFFSMGGASFVNSFFKSNILPKITNVLEFQFNEMVKKHGGFPSKDKNFEKIEVIIKNDLDTYGVVHKGEYFRLYADTDIIFPFFVYNNKIIKMLKLKLNQTLFHEFSHISNSEYHNENKFVRFINNLEKIESKNVNLFEDRMIVYLSKLIKSNNTQYIQEHLSNIFDSNLKNFRNIITDIGTEIYAISFNSNGVYADIEDDLVNKDLELIKKEQLPNHIANAIEYLLFIEDMKPQIIPYATICKRTSTKHRAQNYYKSFFKLLLKTNPEVRARITRIYKMYVEFVIEAEPIVKRTKGQPLTKENIQKTIYNEKSILIVRKIYYQILRDFREILSNR
ncbi:hypothetical protein HN777_05240 [Candidatus Woesearchaeota archaeon]|jgi:hypothetical protein|nr:hypothetical protein [Candidatus Woesearchaeota archaeon]